MNSKSNNNLSQNKNTKKFYHHQRQLSKEVINIQISELSEIVNALQNLILEEIKGINLKLMFPKGLNIQSQANNQDDSIELNRILEKHKILQSISVFSFYNQQQKQLNTIQNISESYKEIAIQLMKIYASLLQNKEFSCLFFDNNVQLYDFIKSISNLENSNFIKFFVSELFILLKNTNHSIFKINTLFELTQLYIYGIQIPSPKMQDMKIHRAIFEQNLPLLRRLCISQEKTSICFNVNQSDLLGCSPLMLAIKLQNRESAIVCSQNNGDPTVRTMPQAFTPMEEAININMETLIKPLIISHNSIRQNVFEQKVIELEQTLLKIQDFMCDIKWEATSSFIPFIKKWTPNDIYTFYKHKGMFRIDMGLLDQSQKWQKVIKIYNNCCKGSWSLLFKKRKLFLIDHMEQKVTNLMQDISSNILDQLVTQYLNKEVKPQEYSLKQIELQTCRSWRGDIIMEETNSFKTQKIQAKGYFQLDHPYENIFNSIDFKQFENFEQYFEYQQQNSLFLNIEEYRFQENIIEKLKQLQDGIGPFKLEKQQKQINADIWITEDFPIKLSDINAILEILAFPFRHFEILRDFFLGVEKLNPKIFPIKVQIPLFLTINTVVEFDNFQFQAIDEKFFEIDDQIKKVSKAPKFASKLQSNSSSKNKKYKYMVNHQYGNRQYSSQNDNLEDDDQESLEKAHELFNQLVDNDQQDDLVDLLDVKQKKSVCRTQNSVTVPSQNREQLLINKIKNKQLDVQIPFFKSSNNNDTKKQVNTEIQNVSKKNIEDSCENYNKDYLNEQQKSESSSTPNTKENVQSKMKIFNTNNFNKAITSFFCKKEEQLIKSEVFNYQDFQNSQQDIQSDSFPRVSTDVNLNKSQQFQPNKSTQKNQNSSQLSMKPYLNMNYNKYKTNNGQKMNVIPTKPEIEQTKKIKMFKQQPNPQQLTQNQIKHQNDQLEQLSDQEK